MQDAKSMGDFLEAEVEEKGMPRPDKYFVSWLSRTGQTMGGMWGWTTEGPVSENDRGGGVHAIALKVGPKRFS